MNTTQALVMGIDLGTQGVRCLVSSLDGTVVAEGKKDLERATRQGSWFEQNPREWWSKTLNAIEQTMDHLKSNGFDPTNIKAISCDSTSGTVLAVHENGEVLYPAIMYNDSRASEEAALINAVAREFTEKLGYRFDPSFALCKVLWLKRNRPDVFEKTRYFLHAGDFITSKLTGKWGVSDISNSLKMGFDLVDNEWPLFIEKDLAISRECLPRVLNSGEPIGCIHSRLAYAFGLDPSTVVAAGATDGTAGFYASGASRAGDVSATLGTTLVIRSMSHNLVKDPLGRVYCHRHPNGFWLPGGASNTGGNILNHLFPQENYPEMDQRITKKDLPTSLTIYPLTGRGERLPFAKPEAEFFQIGQEKSRKELYAACLEGVGYVERYCYQLLADLGSTPISQVFVSGSGATSLTWCSIRSSILGLPLSLPRSTESAMGACVMAAATLLGGLEKAGNAMVQIQRVIEPDPAQTLRYLDRYQLFLDECRKRGYLIDEGIQYSKFNDQP